MKNYKKMDENEVAFVENIILTLIGKYSKKDAEKIVYSQLDNMNCQSEFYIDIVDSLLEKHFGKE